MNLSLDERSLVGEKFGKCKFDTGKRDTFDSDAFERDKSERDKKRMMEICLTERSSIEVHVNLVEGYRKVDRVSLFWET